MSLFDALFPPATERRSWLHDDDALWGIAPTASGAVVTRDSAMRLSTVWACVRLLTNTIASLPTEIIVSIAGRKFPEYTKPDWLLAPDPADPTMTPVEHFAQVTTSILLDGNFFVYAPDTVFSPSPLIVLDPRRVEIRNDGRAPRYDILDEYGRVKTTVDAMHMLHGVWIKLPGQLRGISPIEAARQGIGLGLTAEEFGARFFGQGTTLSYGVEVPGPMTDQQREELRGNLKQRHAGTRNAHSVSVLTNGAKFVPGLGVTNEQAQFLELRKFQVEDIARIFGVPPHMVGSQEPGASSYNSVEQRSLEFREYAVLPLIRRIEDPYQRLVEPPTALTGATAAFRFNIEGIARADLKTRYESYNTGIMAGVLKPNEARALEDLPPVPGGDVTYMQQQMVPLGTPPPAPPAPPAPEPEDEDEEEDVNERDVRKIVAEMMQRQAPMPDMTSATVVMPIQLIQPAPVVENVVNIPEQRLEAPIVNITNDVQTPTVNVTNEVATPSVSVRNEMPEMRAEPTGYVQDIRIVEMPKTKKRIVRDVNGRPSGLVEE